MRFPLIHVARWRAGFASAALLSAAALYYASALGVPAEKAPASSVEVRLSPGDAGSPIVLGRKGSVSVTILGSASLAVSTIDRGSIHIGGAEANKERITLPDVNADGLPDLVFRVPVGALRLHAGSAILTLSAATTDGQPVVGTVVAEAVKPPAIDPAQEKLSPYPVQIDVEPGDAANVLDLGGQGDVQVAIFSSATFNALDVDPETVNLAGAPVEEGPDGDLEVTTADVNGDGRLDLIVSVMRRAVRLTPGGATAELRGAIKGGRPFFGSAQVQVLSFAAPPHVSPAFATTFSNPTPILIPAAGTSGIASPYPSNIAVSGLAGSVTSVIVSLKSLTHTFPDDIDVLLVGPQGQNLIALSDVGGDPNVSAVTLTLDDAAAAPPPDAGPLVTGTFRPSNVGTGDTFAAPAPAPSGGIL